MTCFVRHCVVCKQVQTSAVGKKPSNRHSAECKDGWRDVQHCQCSVVQCSALIIWQSRSVQRTIGPSHVTLPRDPSLRQHQTLRKLVVVLLRPSSSSVRRIHIHIHQRISSLNLVFSQDQSAVPLPTGSGGRRPRALRRS